jgi:hypothetical protein
VVLHLEPDQLIPQAGFALAHGVHPTSDCRHPLADGAGEPLHQGGMEGPAAARQDLLQGQPGAEDPAVRAPHKAPAPL